VAASSRSLAPTAVEGDTVAFRLPDAAHHLAGVGLWCDLDLGAETAFGRVDGGWELRLPRPRVDRIEYLLELTHPGQGPVREPDPGNPLRVSGPFGEQSWLPLPGYAAPDWLAVRPVAHRRVPVVVTGTPVGRVEVDLWAPADADHREPLPLLLCHDGPEMDRFGGLTHFVGAMTSVGRLPRMRVALLAPGERNRRYSANPAYAAALCRHVVPKLSHPAPSVHRPVLMGQSLGGLAALHAAWTYPGTFAGVFLQSGSYFTPELDPQESAFEYWKEVTGFVASLLAAPTAAPDAPETALTCGTAEENYANNRLLAEHLSRVGMSVTWGEVRDGHTWTCWRDLLDPPLTELLTKVW